MLNRETRRYGFTLIEVLVALFIVGLLMALLLPAVQSAREAARRVSCANNLRQIGQAIAGYHDAFGCLPPGRFLTYDPRYSGREPPCTAPAVDKSFLLYILPFIEQSNLYNAINHDLTIFGVENTTIHTFSLAVYACPSDPMAGYPRDLAPKALQPYAPDPPGGRRRMTFTSYSACFGSFRVDAIPRTAGGCVVAGQLRAQANGVINDISPIGFASVSDGLGNTLFVTEKSTTAASKLVANSPSLNALHGWYVAGNWGDTLMTTFYPPNPYNKVSTYAPDALLTAASSQHPGGMQALMGDGSVRFIKDTVHSWPFEFLTGSPVGAIRAPGGWWTRLPVPGIWQALGTRAGGETVSADAF